MKNSEVLKINDSVSWIGILDKDIVTFDIVMETKHGTTYNSYFIDADKKTIIDTAKETYSEQYIEKVKEVVNPSDIEYIILNHTEPDHSGCLKHLLALAPDAKVCGSRQALNYINEMTDIPFESQILKEGDEIDLGNKTLRFINAPNLHWPDTIYTYLVEDKFLFTCDSFGAHYCNEKMFDDLVGDYSDDFDYYFNVILKPFSKFMVKAIEKISSLDIQIICPGHGPILRSSWKEIVKKTENMAERYIADSLCEENNILITYVSAYGYTKSMADTIAQGIQEIVKYPVNIIDLEHTSLGDVEELIVRSNAILIGSPTINQNTLLPVYKMFALINPIRDKGKKAAAFGSYGWSGEAVKLIEGHLRSLKLNIVLDGAAYRFTPNNDKKEFLQEFGRNFARQLLE